MTEPPVLLSLDACGGDWDRYVEVLYERYVSEIVNGGLVFRGLPIRCQYRPPTHGKHFGFWHVIATGRAEEDRTPDLRRCERLPWIAWVISHAESDDAIAWWENKRGSSTHVVLWLKAHDYVVIVARRSGYYLLKTAYCVEPHRRKRLLREMEEYWKGRKG